MRNKKYIAPQIEVIILYEDMMLLAGSDKLGGINQDLDVDDNLEED